MKFYKIFIVGLLLLILAAGTVSAEGDANATDEVISAENQDEIIAEEGDDEYEIDFPDTVEDEFDTIDVEIPTDEEGDLSVNINGTPVNLKKTIEYDPDDEESYDVYVDLNVSDGSKTVNLKDDPDDLFSIRLNTLMPGTYQINVIFKTTAKTYSNTGVVTVLGPDIPEEVTIDAEDTYIYGVSSNRISIDAASYSISDLNVKIDGVNFTCIVQSGELLVDISGLQMGKHTIVVTYNGGKNSTSADFDVVSEIYCPDEITYGSSDYIILKLAEDATGSLSVSIDGGDAFTVSMSDGEVKALIPLLDVGTHDVQVSYVGGNYDVENLTTQIEVIPKVTCPSVMNAGENKYIVVEVGNATGELLVEVDGNKYASLNFTGRAEINLANLDDEEYTLSVNFVNADVDYDEDFEIKVKSVAPRITGAKSLNIVYTTKTYYTFTVYGTNAKLAREGEKVTVKINKKTYTAYTDKNGVVKFKMPILKVGKYAIAATYKGLTVKKNVVVKHVIKLQKVNVKKSADQVTIKVTLKKVNGKYLKKQKITLKFKGKKYTAETNKKGVVKFTIPSKVIKKLKAGKKITYKATYKKDTVKQTVKIKK